MKGRKSFVRPNATSLDLFAFRIDDLTRVLADEVRGVFADQLCQDDTFRLVDDQVVSLDLVE